MTARAAVLRHERLRLGGKSDAQAVVRELYSHRLPSFARATDLHRHARFQRVFADGREIVGGETEHGGHAAGYRFNDVLVAGVNQAAAGEGRATDRVIREQFAHVVVYPHLRLRRDRRIVAALLHTETE